MEPNISWRLHPWTPIGQSVDSHYLGLLGWATVHGHYPLLDLVLGTQGPKLRKEVFSIPFHQYGGLPILHLAARAYDNINFLRLMEKCDVRATDQNGRTALHHAAEVGALTIVNFLVHAKADVNARDVGSLQPLHLAIRNGYVSIIEMLLWWGAEVHKKVGSSEKTPFQMAAEGNNEKIMECLINKTLIRPKLNDKNEALYVAAEHGWSSIVAQLCKDGVAIKVKVKDNLTAFEIAMANGHIAAAKEIARANGHNAAAMETMSLGGFHPGEPMFNAANVGQANIMHARLT